LENSLVFVYRNLNRKGVVWSIKDWKTKKVVDRVTEVYLIDAELKVSDAGRLRVLKEMRKNVHAGVKGTRVPKYPWSDNLNWIRATYNPYWNYCFVTINNEPIKKAKYAKLTDNGLFVANN
jgi:hypothetical protein